MRRVEVITEEEILAGLHDYGWDDARTCTRCGTNAADGRGQMSKLLGVDRSLSKPGDVPDSTLRQWTAEIDALMEKLRKDLTCPNCGGLMVYGEPCEPRQDRSEEP